MKKLFLLLLLLTLLTSCSTAQQTSLVQLENDMLQKSGSDDFLLADPDFININFGTPHYLLVGHVYISKSNDGRELGFFELTDAKYQSDMLARIRNYLEGEKEAVRSLAALYPTDELQARLARFEKASFGASDTLVYYMLP